MKILGLLLMISVTGYQCGDIDSYATIKDIIDEFINSLSEIVPDELPLPDREIDVLRTDNISLSTQVYNTTLGGLKGFKANVVYAGTIIPIPTRVTIDYAKLYTRSEYITKLALNFLPSTYYENHGYLYSEVINMNLLGAITFSLSPLGLQLKDLTFQVEDVEVVVEGLFGSKLLSRFLSALLSKYGAQIINDSADVLTPVITEVINSFLSTYFPRSPNMEQIENVDYGSYTQEELNAKADLLRARLDSLLRDLKDSYA